MTVKYEDMQRKFIGRIKTAAEHELWNHWVAKDEDYRLAVSMAYLGWAIAIVGPLSLIFF